MRSFILRTAFIATIIVGFPFSVFADTLFLSPSTGTYSSGQVFAVTIYVSSTAQAANAFSGSLKFPTDKLQVTSISKTGSIVTLWVEEPEFSNTAGTLDYAGVIPNPGYRGSNGALLTVNFRVVGQGSADFKFTSGSVLANDGNGTNILKNSGTATYTLGGAPIPVEEPVEKIDPNLPKAPVVTSKDFPESSVWYNKTSGTFEWKTSSGITAVRILQNKIAQSSPTLVYEPAINSKELTEIGDGAWYLHVQLKNSYGWGGIAHYLFKVDTTKPESVSVKEIARKDETDPKPRFAISASDATSGIDHYTIQIDSGETIEWRDDGKGIYSAGIVGPGNHTLFVRAYDEAGNYAVSSTDFTIEPLETPIITSYSKEVSPDTQFFVNGTTFPNALIHIFLTRKGADPLEFTAKADADGTFSAMYEDTIPRGTYKLYAVAEDLRGARSFPSDEKSVVVRTPWLIALGGALVKIFEILLVLLALGFTFFWLLFWSKKKVRDMKKELEEELEDVETTVDKAFEELKKSIEENIHMLEKAQRERQLTYEESKIISRFKESLTDTEKMIVKEIRRVEKDIEKK